MRSLIALVATAAAGVLLLAWHWDHLPEQVASHFSNSGIANGWMSRDAHLVFTVGLILGLTALFLAIGAMIRRFPARWVNIPHKDYWFSPERETETRGRLCSWTYGFGALLNIYLLFVFHMVYLASTADPVVIDNPVMIFGLILFLAIAIASVIALLKRFGKTPDY